MMGEQWRLAEARRDRRLLRLSLLVRRPAAAGGAARRPARPPRGAVPLLSLLGQRGLAAQLGRALRRHPDAAELRRGLRGRRSPPAPCPISPTPATPGPTAAGRASSIYRPTDLPDPAASVARLRAAWAAAGHPEVELGAVLFHVEGESPVAPELFDFWVEMPPHGLVGQKDYLVGGPEPPAPGLGPDAQFRGLVYDYEAVIRNSLARRFRRGLAGRVIAGVMPSWDNTARRRRDAHIAHGANPARFGKWLRGALPRAAGRLLPPGALRQRLERMGREGGARAERPVRRAPASTRCARWRAPSGGPRRRRQKKSSMSEIILHVGTHKTGTTTIQDTLFHNRAAARGARRRLPADRADRAAPQPRHPLDRPAAAVTAPAARRWRTGRASPAPGPGASETVLLSSEEFSRMQPRGRLPRAPRPRRRLRPPPRRLRPAQPARLHPVDLRAGDQGAGLRRLRLFRQPVRAARTTPPACALDYNLLLDHMLAGFAPRRARAHPLRGERRRRGAGRRLLPQARRCRSPPPSSRRCRPATPTSRRRRWRSGSPTRSPPRGSPAGRLVGAGRGGARRRRSGRGRAPRSSPAARSARLRRTFLTANRRFAGPRPRDRPRLRAGAAAAAPGHRLPRRSRRARRCSPRCAGPRPRASPSRRCPRRCARRRARRRAPAAPAPVQPRPLPRRPRRARPAARPSPRRGRRRASRRFRTRPPPIAIAAERMVVAWSPKSACSHVALWTFLHEGLAAEAAAYHELAARVPDARLLQDRPRSAALAQDGRRRRRPRLHPAQGHPRPGEAAGVDVPPRLPLPVHAPRSSAAELGIDIATARHLAARLRRGARRAAAGGPDQRRPAHLRPVPPGLGLGLRPGDHPQHRPDRARRRAERASRPSSAWRATDFAAHAAFDGAAPDALLAAGAARHRRPDRGPPLRSSARSAASRAGSSWPRRWSRAAGRWAAMRSTSAAPTSPTAPAPCSAAPPEPVA